MMSKGCWKRDNMCSGSAVPPLHTLPPYLAAGRDSAGVGRRKGGRGGMMSKGCWKRDDNVVGGGSTAPSVLSLPSILSLPTSRQEESSRDTCAGGRWECGAQGAAAQTNASIATYGPGPSSSTLPPMPPSMPHRTASRSFLPDIIVMNLLKVCARRLSS